MKFFFYATPFFWILAISALNSAVISLFYSDLISPSSSFDFDFIMPAAYYYTAALLDFSFFKSYIIRFSAIDLVISAIFLTALLLHMFW